jgi:hypothetical protein
VAASVWVIETKAMSEFVSEDVWHAIGAGIHHDTAEVGEATDGKVSTRDVSCVEDGDHIRFLVPVDGGATFGVVEHFTVVGVIFVSRFPQHKYESGASKDAIDIRDVLLQDGCADDGASTCPANCGRHFDVEGDIVLLASFAILCIAAAVTLENDGLDTTWYDRWLFAHDRLFQAVARTSIA